MTLQELYESIGGDYEQALRVLRVEKLIDKHIRKLTGNGVVDNLLAAGETMDPTQLFEAAHATKGVCANLGLTRIAGLASEVAEEFRPGTPRTMSDDEVKDRLRAIDGLYETTKEGIARYVAE
jgi:HPt (histidine-containing phosphotransfer) domain-containing protein